MDESRIRVVVIGGGLAGLAASLFLGRRGHRVVLLEADRSLPRGGPDEVFSGWPRPGVPQARQPHNFLARSVRVLRAEAPDVLEALLRRGVLRIGVDLGDGPDDALLCSRRPVFEQVVRRAVEAEPSVTFRTGARVTDLGLRAGDVPTLTRVVTDAGEAIPGDLIVDAAGRRSPIPDLLTAHGARPPVIRIQRSGLMYVSRYYRLRAGRDYPRLDSPIMASLGWARSMAFPADNGTFALLATIAAIDPLRRALVTEEGFTRFHASVPAISPWLQAGDPVSPPRAMARLENRRRRLVDAGGPIVGGLVLLGDSALHTNPTAGRGVSLAFAHAQHLGATIHEAADPAAYAGRFEEWSEANIGAWYAPQAAADATLVRRMEAAVKGRPAPPPDPMERVRAGAFAAARTDDDVAIPLRRMLHLVSPPEEVLGDRAVLSGIERLLRDRPELAAPAAGSSRERFVASLVAQRLVSIPRSTG